MPRYKMIVMSDPLPGREEEFDQWYQNVHLPEMVALQGFKSARRLRQCATLGARKSYSHAVIYEIETDDIDAVVNNLVQVAEDAELTMSDAMDRENTYAAVYEELGTEVLEP